MPERAALRDAGFYANPRTDTTSTYVPRYHVVAANGSGPACDPEGTLLVVDDSRYGDEPRDQTVAAEDVPVSARCQRPGCAARWPAADPGDDPAPSQGQKDSSDA